MGYRKRRGEEDVGWGLAEDAGRGTLSTGTGPPSDGWGLEEDDGWTPLVVRERTSGSDSGELGICLTQVGTTSCGHGDSSIGA